MRCCRAVSGRKALEEGGYAVDLAGRNAQHSDYLVRGPLWAGVVLGLNILEMETNCPLSPSYFFDDRFLLCWPPKPRLRFSSRTPDDALLDPFTSSLGRCRNRPLRGEVILHRPQLGKSMVSLYLPFTLRRAEGACFHGQAAHLHAEIARMAPAPWDRRKAHARYDGPLVATALFTFSMRSNG